MADKDDFLDKGLLEEEDKHNYIALDIVQEQQGVYKQVKHLSKLYFWLLVIGSLTSFVLGLWIMTSYFKNSTTPWLEYTSTWQMIFLILIPFLLSVFIAFWFWKQFERYNVALGEYIKIPTLESASIMYKSRSRFWYIVYLLYLVWFIMFIIGLFLPSPDIPTQINNMNQ